MDSTQKNLLSARTLSTRTLTKISLYVLHNPQSLTIRKAPLALKCSEYRNTQVFYPCSLFFCAFYVEYIELEQEYHSHFIK